MTRLKRNVNSVDIFLGAMATMLALYIGGVFLLNQSYHLDDADVLQEHVSESTSTKQSTDGYYNDYSVCAELNDTEKLRLRRENGELFKRLANELESQVCGWFDDDIQQCLEE